MAKLTDAQQKQLDELTALASAPDEEEFDVQIWDGDKGAQVPYSKGRTWLQKTFGIDLGDPPADDDADAGGADDAGSEPKNVKAFGRTIRKTS